MATGNTCHPIGAHTMDTLAERVYKGWTIKTRTDGSSKREYWVFPPDEVNASDITDRLWTAKALIDTYINTWEA